MALEDRDLVERFYARFPTIAVIRSGSHLHHPVYVGVGDAQPGIVVGDVAARHATRYRHLAQVHGRVGLHESLHQLVPFAVGEGGAVKVESPFASPLLVAFVQLPDNLSHQFRRVIGTHRHLAQIPAQRFHAQCALGLLCGACHLLVADVGEPHPCPFAGKQMEIAVGIGQRAVLVVGIYIGIGERLAGFGIHHAALDVQLRQEGAAAKRGQQKKDGALGWVDTVCPVLLRSGF